MKRRSFILALTGSLTCLHYLYKPKGNELSAAHSVDMQFKSMFTNPADAREIGQLYLDAFPHHAKRTFLEQQVGLNNQLDPIKAFEDKREQDFLIGNTVSVDGWVLANAEACVCALLAMSAV